MRTRTSLRLGIAMVAMAVLMTPVASADASSSGRDPLAAFASQRLTWTECPGLDAPDFQCAEVKVPLDYTHPDRRTITVVITRRPAKDPAGRRGVLLTTGGGPGGGGVVQAVAASRQLPTSVTDRFDIVGVDQRFVERSTPISCGRPQEDPGEFWVRSPQIPFEAVMAEARAYARGCAANAGWALPHATTANAVRDLDVIRAVLGERRVSFFGSSYAAYVGAVYTKLFPSRVDRFVLDSPVDPGRVWRVHELLRSRSFEIGLARWCRFAAAADATYGLGTTGQAACDAWWSVVAALSVRPVAFWTVEEFGSYTFQTMYDDHGFPALAAATAALRARQLPSVAAPPSLPRAPGTPVDNHTAASTAYRCGDAPWPTDPAVYQRDVASYGARYPFVGGYNANITPCAFWPSRPDARVSLDGDRATGILVVATLFDPATPYDGSVNVHNALPNSRLITLDAQVHAPVLYYGDGCVNDLVAAYLTDGTLPATDMMCAGTNTPI
jgi:pimeloyl-ACP methyl ester carboxylesterase